MFVFVFKESAAKLWILDLGMMLIIAMSALAQVYGDRGRKVMSEINVGNNYGSLGVANVTDPSTSKLGHTASVQFMFAMLQLELADRKSVV